MDRLFSEYETCKSDKVEFEDMVDRLSKEMEERIEGLKRDHKEAIAAKDLQLRDMYSKVSVSFSVLVNEHLCVNKKCFSAYCLTLNVTDAKKRLAIVTSFVRFPCIVCHNLVRQPSLTHCQT